jgi:hypothetical protein
MIQLADDGSVLAEPSKSSLHTRLHPAGVGGTVALAVMVAVTVAPRRVTDTVAASRARRRRGLAGNAGSA